MFAFLLLIVPVSEELFFGLLGTWGVSAVDQQRDIHEIVEAYRTVATTPQDLCVKLRHSDYNKDAKVDVEDYNLLYQEVLELNRPGFRSVRDHETRLQMDIVNRGESTLHIDEEDLGMLYNYITNQLAYCPHHS